MSNRFEQLKSGCCLSTLSWTRHQSRGNVTAGGGRSHSGINTKHTVISLYRDPLLLYALKHICFALCAGPALVRALNIQLWKWHRASSTAGFFSKTLWCSRSFISLCSGYHHSLRINQWPSPYWHLCSPGRSQNRFTRLCGAWNFRSNRGVPLGESNTPLTASSHGSGFCFRRLFTRFGPLDANTEQSKASLHWYYSTKISFFFFIIIIIFFMSVGNVLSQKGTRLRSAVHSSLLLRFFFALHCFKQHFALISSPEKMTLCDLVSTINIHTYLQGRTVSFDWGSVDISWFLLLTHRAGLYMWQNVDWRHAERRQRGTQ